jgi:hypothetical protein
MFLIETSLIARFAVPYVADHIDTLKKACLKTLPGTASH